MNQENQICKCGHTKDWHDSDNCGHIEIETGDPDCQCKKFEPKMTEFNLSENQSTFEDDDREKTYWYREDFVKEFIKKLKEARLFFVSNDKDCNAIIDKLAGEKLK